MPTPTADTYTAASGATLQGGRQAAPSGGIVSASLQNTDQYVAGNVQNQFCMLQLHGSGGFQPAFGDGWLGTFDAALTYDDSSDMFFAVQGYQSDGYTAIKPWDRQTPYPSNGQRRESYWMGWTDGSPKVLYLYTEKRLDAILDWVEVNYPQLSRTRRGLIGNSMGAWGGMTYGGRRPNRFAALYLIAPRVRYSSAGVGYVMMPDWFNPQVQWPTSATPNLYPAHGSGTAAEHLNMVSYAANAANAMPWVGWCVGRNDGYMPFQDHVDFVAAMRSAGRGFAFAWNDGDHGTGDIISQIISSYAYGTFEVGVGYPIYTNNSGDQDPAVDLVGGINLGFSHRNVVESAGAWSCEIRNLLGARTVTVRPKSSIFTASVAPQVVSVPAGSAWVTVSFTG